MECEGFSAPCGKYKAIKYRMNTAFVNDERNYRVLCPKCQEESVIYWREQWGQYYAGVL